MSQAGLRLFDRPLSRDPVLRLWVGALGVVALVSLARNVELGADYNPERVSGFLMDVLAGAVLSFLLLAWFPALLRWVWRYGSAYPVLPRQQAQPTWRPGDPARTGYTGAPFRGRRPASAWRHPRGPRRRGRWGAAADAHARSWQDGERPEVGAVRELSPDQPLSEGRHGWSSSSARRSDVGEARPGAARWLQPEGGTPTRGPQEYQRPPDVLLSVDSLATVPGVPVEVSWRADGAEYVTVEGIDQRLPPSGTLAVHLDTSRDLVVTAYNQHGATSSRTELVRVLPVPVLHAVRFPAMGDVSLNASVRVGIDWDEPVMRRVDQVLAAQQQLRAARVSAPAQPAVPQPVIDAVRGLSRLAESTRAWRVGRAMADADVLPVEAAPMTGIRAWLHRACRAAVALLRRLAAGARALRPRPSARPHDVQLDPGTAVTAPDVSLLHREDHL